MSHLWINRVIDTSPLKGAEFSVHMMMANLANDDGELWWSQEHLAEKARVSESTVDRALRRMRREGLLMSRMIGTTMHYFLLDRDVTTTLAERHSDASQASPRRTKQQGTVNEPTNPSFAARTGPEEGAQMNVGMPDDLAKMDEPERKPMRKKPGDPPPEDTFKRCEVEFHNRVLSVLGRPQYDLGFLRGVISGLHKGDYGRVCSYQEIHEVILPMYFVRNEEYLRANRDQINVVRHFVSQINHGLLNQAEPGMRRAGGPSLREKILARKAAQQ